MTNIIFSVVLCPDVHLISVNLPDCGFVNREGAETGPQYTIYCRNYWYDNKPA